MIQSVTDYICLTYSVYATKISDTKYDDMKFMNSVEGQPIPALVLTMVSAAVPAVD